jgi:YVTN family beta-propeller protein
MRREVVLLLVCVIVFSPVLSSARADAPNLATKSNSIAITSEGGRLVVVNPDSNSVSVINLADNAVATEIPVGVDPRAVAVDETRQQIYVANQGSDSLSVIDLNDNSVISEIEVGDRPVGVVLSPDGQHLFVAELGDDAVRRLDASTLGTLSVLHVPDRPHGLAVTPDGSRLLVTHLLSGELTVISLDRADVPSPVSTWLNVAPAPAVVVNSTGTRAYLAQTMAHGQGLNTQFDTSVFPKVSVVNLETLTHETAEHISLPETDQPVGLPWDVALARDDRELWVVNSASNDLSVIDISNPNRPTRAAHIVVGDNPRGVVIRPDGRYAYVNNTLSGTVSVIDAQTYAVIEEITTTTIPLPPLLLNGKRLFFSSATSELARAGWISCNTCHIEGEQDGRTWQLQYIGEVPPGANPVIIRNTTSLLGMIETYPLRWSAEWDESADSEFSVRFEQYGTGLIYGAEMHPTLGTPNQGRSYDLDSLAAFIDSLQLPERAHELNEQEERGRAIFEAEETPCAACHPAPLYTDLQVHDVGTANQEGEWFGPLVDTPTLRFLYDSAPYLHDGSAPTLLDVLTTANSADEHGVTSHLTETELEDLIAFLLVLPYSGQGEHTP